MALSTTQKALIIVVTLATLAGTGYYLSKHTQTFQFKPKDQKKTRKRSIKSDTTSTEIKKEEKLTKSNDSAKLRRSSQDSAKKLSESAAAVARGETNLSTKEKEELAAQLKEEGNLLFNDALYKEAAQLYSEAIQLHPDNPVYYCNRAACYSYMQEYQQVISDCSKALEFDKTYLKALNRRSNAYVQVGKLREALNDLSVVSVLEKFKKESTITETDRLMKLLVEQESSKVPSPDLTTFPSHFVMDTYFNSFSSLKYPDFKENESDSDSIELALKQALVHLEKKEYVEALEFSSKACKEAEEDHPCLPCLLNVYGTLVFLQGQTEVASEALERSLQLDPLQVNTVTKVCNLHLERGEADRALQAFDVALRKFPRCSDLYYHRGQLQFLMHDFGSAVRDFEKCLEMDSDHVFGHVQLAVAKFKKGQTEAAMQLFEQAHQKFPLSSDIPCYFGELLMEQQQFDDALVQFDKAIQLGSLMAHIDKAMLLHRVYHKSKEAIELIEDVLTKDPKFDLAHIQLGILLLNQPQTPNEKEALEHFDSAIQNARNPFELTNAISAKEHALAQHYVQQYLPSNLL